MKVLLANGSPHTEGFTAHQLRLVEKGLKERGIETFWWQLADKPIKG